MRVLILSQWYSPEPNLVAAPLARGLLDLGHEVQVLTGFPNYPGGNIYPGYKVRPLQKEVLDGVPVVRVPLYPSHDRSGLKRALNYGSFAFAATFIGTMVTKKPDVVYVYHPPATVGLAAEVMRLFRRSPFVYHIQDLWPDTLSATGMMNSQFVLKAIDKWCRRLYKTANDIIVLSPGFKDLLVERGVPERKIHVIYNWSEENGPQLKTLDPEIVAAFEDESKFRIVFAGNMGKAQGLEAVIDAAGLLLNDYPDIEFVFIGAGVSVSELKHYTATVGAHNVKFLPRQPRTKIDAVLEQADVLLVHLKDDPLFSITVPSKTQAYLAVGKPILMGVSGDAADLVQSANAGLTCKPGNPASIAEGVRQLYQMSNDELKAMGQRGREFYKRNLSLNRGVKSIERVLTEAVRR